MPLGKSFHLPGVSLSSNLKQPPLGCLGLWHGTPEAGERAPRAPRGAGACPKPGGAHSAGAPYLAVACGAPRSTIAAAGASEPPEQRGKRARGRSARTAETLGNIAEKHSEVPSSSAEQRPRPPLPLPLPTPGPARSSLLGPTCTRSRELSSGPAGAGPVSRLQAAPGARAGGTRSSAPAGGLLAPPRRSRRVEGAIRGALGRQDSRPSPRSRNGRWPPRHREPGGGAAGEPEPEPQPQPQPQRGGLGTLASGPSGRGCQPGAAYLGSLKM